MIDKIISFLDIYLIDVYGLIEKHGKFNVISAGLCRLIGSEIFTSDELRKDLSLHIRRIISEREFNYLLDKSLIHYANILVER